MPYCLGAMCGPEGVAAYLTVCSATFLSKLKRILTSSMHIPALVLTFRQNKLCSSENQLVSYLFIWVISFFTKESLLRSSIIFHIKSLSLKPCGFCSIQRAVFMSFICLKLWPLQCHLNSSILDQNNTLFGLYRIKSMNQKYCIEQKNPKT